MNKYELSIAQAAQGGYRLEHAPMLQMVSDECKRDLIRTLRTNNQIMTDAITAGGDALQLIQPAHENRMHQAMQQFAMQQPTLIFILEMTNGKGGWIRYYHGGHSATYQAELRYAPFEPDEIGLL